MNDHRKLFKANGIVFNESQRQKENKNWRQQKRNDTFSKNRNIEGLLTSTPLPKATKSRPQEEAENVDPNSKTQRKEAYLKRFIEWKNEKQNGKGSKKETKPPFIPCGKPKKAEDVSTKSFAPQNYVFKFKKEDTIYLAIPTPPRPSKNPSVSGKSITATKLKFNSVERPVVKAINNFNSREVAKTDPIEKPAVKAINNFNPREAKKTAAIEKPAVKAINNFNSSEVNAVAKTENKKPIAPTTKRVVPTIKEPSFKKPTVSVAATKTKVSSTGAIAKAKALNNKNMPTSKQPERAKLAVSLKAKNKNKMSTLNLNKKKKRTSDQHEILTPLELCKTNENFEFMTSTRRKSMDLKTDFLNSSKIIISPITNAAATETKITNNQNLDNGKQKYNFIIRQELEMTTDINDETIIQKTEDKTIKNLTTNPQISLVEKTLVPNLNPAPIEIIQKSSSSNGNQQQHPGQIKKYNFLRKISLNETSYISPDFLSKSQTTFEPKSPNVDTPKRIFRQRNTLDHTITSENPKVDKQLQENNQQPTTPERSCNYLSPFVTCSRGKVSAQKEREKRNSIYLAGTPNKISTAEILPKIETPIEKRRAREAVTYFRKQLNNEIERLHGLCDKWEIYKNENLEILQQNAGEDMIDVTIGQAKLLTSKKFKQFSGLIDRCEANANGTAPEDDGSEKTKIITPIDLEGFWAMLNLQVDNIDKRFENLNNWKSNEWQDPEALQKLQQNSKPKRFNKSKVTTAAIVKPNAGLVQKMREMRAAMRAKKTEVDDATLGDKQTEEQKTAEAIVKYCSPRRLRRSTLTKNETTTNLNSSQHLLPIIVPNRRSRSIARTVILVPSPIQRLSKSPKSSPQPSLLALLTSNNKRNRRSKSSNLLTPNLQQEAPIERTPSPINGYKPILKTPGTARLQARNVSFNFLCSVKKFRKFGVNQEATEYDEVQEIPIDDLKKKFSDEGESPTFSDETETEQSRVYRLRNRKVKLRPSCEIELPRK